MHKGLERHLFGLTIDHYLECHNNVRQIIYDRIAQVDDIDDAIDKMILEILVHYKDVV